MKDTKSFWAIIISKLKLTNTPLEFIISEDCTQYISNSSIQGVSYILSIKNNFPEVHVQIESTMELTKYFYNHLYKQKKDLETEFGNELIWNSNFHNLSKCRISHNDLTLNYKYKGQWDKISDFITNSIVRLFQIVQVKIEILDDTDKKQKAKKADIGPLLINKLRIKNFLSFKDADIQVSPHINLIIGENDTCKTGFMKLLYSISKSLEIYSRKEYFEKISFKQALGDKIFDTFQPRENRRIGDLVTKGVNEKLSIEIQFHKTGKSITKQDIQFKFGATTYKTINDCSDEIEPVDLIFKSIFMPAKEVFTAFNTIKYTREKLFLPGFDDTYLDLIKSIEVPIGFKKETSNFDDINNQIEELLGGSIQANVGEEPFIFKKANQKFSISLTSEGIKKIGILSTLIRNKQLSHGCILFMDEPEANLHPKALSKLIEMIVRISKEGVQVFLASHSMLVVNLIKKYTRELDISAFCHLLHKGSDGFIKSQFSDLREGIPDNSIVDETIEIMEIDAD